MIDAYPRSFDLFREHGILNLFTLGSTTQTFVLESGPRTTLSVRCEQYSGSWGVGVITVYGWMQDRWVALCMFGAIGSKHHIDIRGATQLKAEVTTNQAGPGVVTITMLADVEQDRLPIAADTIQHGHIKLFTVDEITDLIDVGRFAGLRIYISAVTWSTAVVTWEQSTDGINWSGFDPASTSTAAGVITLDVRNVRFVRGQTSTAAAAATAPATYVAHADVNAPVVTPFYGKWNTGTARGATNTAVVRGWAAVNVSGTGVTLVASSTNGDYFDITTSGLYAITLKLGSLGTNNTYVAIQSNATLHNLRTSADVLAEMRINKTATTVTCIVRLSAGVKLWAYNDDTSSGGVDDSQITITRLAA